MARTYSVTSADGTPIDLTVEALTEMFTDAKSWVSFFRMAVTGAAATMVAVKENGEALSYTVTPSA